MMARDLPWVQDTMREHVPGIGTFALQSVGNTAHSTGVYAYLRPEGEAAVSRGAMSFKLAITADFRFEWYYEGTALQWLSNEKVFSDEQVRAGLKLVESYDRRDEISFMFLALSAAEMELESKRRQLEDLERSQSALMRASSRPVTATWTPEQVKDRLERVVAKIGEFHSENDGRVDRLKGLVKAIRQWTHDHKGGTILEVMREALADKNDASVLSI